MPDQNRAVGVLAFALATFGGATPIAAENPTSEAPPSISPSPPAIVIERPHKLFERPRPKGAVQAAAADEDLARWNVGGAGDPTFKSSRPSYHPGARVVVDTRVPSAKLPAYARKGSKTLSQWAITAATRKWVYWPYRLCFEASLRRDPKTHGKTVIRARLGSNGRYAHAAVVSTELDEEAARCLAQKTTDTSKLLVKPAPTRELTVELAIKLWPGDAPLPPLDPPDPERWQNPGRLDADEVSRALETALPDLAACYAHGLARDVRLWGRIALEIHQDARGRTPSCATCGKDDPNCHVRCGAPKEHGSRFPDASVARCVRERIRDIEFGEPEGGPRSFVVALRLGEPSLPP